MISHDNIEAVRTRLASRTSFFGGAISTRDNARVKSWKDLPSVKAAAAGRSSARANTCLAPPRPKLTTAAVETSKANRKGKEMQQTRSTSKASKTATSNTVATAADTASVLSVQRTPPETQKRINIPLNDAPPRPSVVPTNAVPSARTKTMLRHQQMTSLGVQTIQLLCIPPQKTSQETHATSVEGKQQQNQVPNSIEKKQVNKDTLPCTVQKQAATSTKPIASPRRHAHPAHIVAKPKIKQRLKGTFYGSAQPPAARHRIRTVDDESDSDLDSFIETDDDEEEEEQSDGAGIGEYEESKATREIKGQAAVHNTDSAGTNTNTRDTTEQQQHVHTADGGNLYLSKRLNAKRNKPKKWKMALREALHGYDASKYADVDAKPDRRMHASFEEILAEEARAADIGREMDRIEAEKEIAARAVEKDNRQKQRQQHPFVVSEDDDSSSGSGDDVLSDSSDDDEEDNGVEYRVRKKRKILAGFLASF